MEGNVPWKFRRSGEALIVSQNAGGHYEEVIAAAVKSGHLPVPGMVGKVCMQNTYHDDWCGIYKREKCNCNPTIEFVMDGDVVLRLESQGAVSP